MFPNSNDLFIFVSSCWIASERYKAPMWVLVTIISIAILFNLAVAISMIYTIYKNQNSVPGSERRRFFFTQSTTSNAESTTTTSGNGSDNSRSRFGKNIGQIWKLGFGTKGKKEEQNRQNQFEQPQFYSQFSNVEQVNRKQQSMVENLKKQLRYVGAYLPIVFMLGFTWGSFTLYLIWKNVIFSYIFIFLNGLQGLFIFLTRIVFSRKSREVIVKRLRRSQYSHFLYPFSTGSSVSRPTESTTQHTDPKSI